jgi:hypothetical protein
LLCFYFGFIKTPQTSSSKKTEVTSIHRA